MEKLIINKLFLKNYLNYELLNFDSNKGIKKNNILPKNYEFSYNFKNLLIKEYLIEKTIKLNKSNKILNFFIKSNYINYKIGMFFNTRKYKFKKLLKKKILKKKN
jgi:ribosomal protein S19